MLKLLFCKASLYSCAAVSNVCLSQDSVLIRLLIEWGSSRRIGGGCMGGSRILSYLRQNFRKMTTPK